MAKHRIHIEVHDLKPGDLYLLFTDGISEAMNARDDLFGEARLGQFVETHAHLPSEELRERIENAMVRPLSAHLTGSDIAARALLATAVLMGSGTVRRLLGLDDLRTVDPEVLTARLTAVFKACLE